MAISSVQMHSLPSYAWGFGLKAVTRLSTGKLVAVRRFEASSDDTHGDIVAYESEDNGLNWVASSVWAHPVTSAAVTLNPVIVVDSTDKLHVCVPVRDLSDNSEDLMYFTKVFGGSTWVSSVAVAVPDVILGFDMSVDGTDAVHLAWAEGLSEEVDVIKHIVVGSTSESVGTSNQGVTQISLDIDSSNGLHIAWLGPNDDYTFVPFYATYTSSWAVAELDITETHSTGDGAEVRMLVDDSDVVHLLYQMNLDNYELFHYKRTAGVWGNPALLVSEDSALHGVVPSGMALDANGSLFFIHSVIPTESGDTALKQYEYTGGVWSEPILSMSDTGTQLALPSLVYSRFPSSVRLDAGYYAVIDCWSPTSLVPKHYYPYFFTVGSVNPSGILEILYDSQSQGDTYSDDVMLPSTSDAYIYKLIGVKNVQMKSVPVMNLQVGTYHGNVQLALGSVSETREDGVMKSYSSAVSLPPMSSGDTVYVWLKWSAPATYVSGDNIIQLNVCTY